MDGDTIEYLGHKKSDILLKNKKEYMIGYKDKSIFTINKNSSMFVINAIYSRLLYWIREDISNSTHNPVII